ncbi:hypothetical protein Mtc_0534 [Methanocella conradii HZ254]|uniref:PGF-CTERM archaeal protein-sorting signal domain-containing protein n=2 Tax=Methanocella TaxID=570266 RepID=H8I5I1_METCZ|nr:hypothetical protein Mtc_0534 [Methanocella conradii HZ254]
MKSKATMLLMLMMALVLGTSIAIADDFVVDPLTSVSGSGWLTTGGIFRANEGGISSTVDFPSRAVHQVTTDPSGAFSFESRFKVNNKSSDVHVGVSSTPYSPDICVGWSAAWNQFIVVKDDTDVLAQLGGTLDPNAVYTAKITSTNGSTFECSVYSGGTQVGKKATVSGFKPGYVVVFINNYNATNGPIIYSVNFKSTSTASPSPSPSPSPQPNNTTSTVKRYVDLQAIRDFYANQPPMPMSDQSIIYNPDGTIKQVINGTKVSTPTASPTVTVKPNVTASPTVQANVTATPSAPTPTKTQSPGFEIVLATVGMIAALALVCRKK